MSELGLGKCPTRYLISRSVCASVRGPGVLLALVTMNLYPTFSLLLSELQTIGCTKVASLALLIFDTILTLKPEYQYIWQRQWNTVKVLYLFNRYSTFLDSIIVVHKRFSPGSDCSEISTFTTIFSGFGIALTELLLMIRTYGMYNSSRKILIFFLMTWLISGGINFWAISRWTKPFEFDIESLIPPFVSDTGIHDSLKCYFGSTSLISAICYMSLLVGEGVIVLMTVIKSFLLWRTARKEGRTEMQLLSWFYKEGTIFYLFVFPFTVMTAVVNKLSPSVLNAGLPSMAETPLRVIHTLLTCRLVLHVREVAEQETQSGTLASFIDFDEGSKMTGTLKHANFTSRKQQGQGVV
ncbi:hypothetical protein K435DRAFT_845154 [Dendrothele bispora CBS 962.96]|uniref:DUF6533 domain-containing protein n=1 Tax=Dendrothele bispora (strain CBS 962.96) TaxID=1314807 RepID=A0A4S8KWB7_DENBC|nr:hypothetical protein K435DRAFT_845154 [Dendrothele bispora CBS 962.96]